MTESESPISKLYRFLPLAERICLGAAIMGMVLRRINLPGDEILKIALFALAGIYFLTAFRPPERVEDEETVPQGFNDLLYTTILPKVAGIGSAVSIVGILFAMIGLKGAVEMITIGFGTLTGTLILFLIGFLRGVESVKSQTTLIYRLVAIWVVCGYYIFR